MARIAPCCSPVLEGRNPGRVYVDRKDTPSWAIVVLDFYATTFIGGTIDQQTLNNVFSKLRSDRTLALVWMPQAVQDIGPPSGRTSVIERLDFFDRAPRNDASNPWSQRIPGRSTIRQIDASLLARCLWRDNILDAFGTEERFLANGLGYCLMRDDEILSEAYGVFRGAGRFEIGAITAEHHRGRGYAALTCTHLITTIEASGLSTYWSCHRNNVASAATARKLGYQVERPYQFLVYERIS